VSVKTKYLDFGLKLATYNIMSSTQSAAADYGSTKTRAANVATAMKDRGVTVFGVQEMESDQFKTLKDKLGSSWSYYPKSYDSSGGLSQRTIFWKNTVYKLASSGRANYPIADTAKGGMPWVKLTHLNSGLQFIVYNHHDVAKNGTAFSGYNDAGGALKREAAAKAIVSSIKQVNTSKLPVFVLGGFNSRFYLRSQDAAYNGNRNRLPYCILTKSNSLQNTYDTNRGVSGQCPTKTGGDVDHIYANLSRTKISGWSQPSVAHASDHNPIIVNATIRRY